MGKRGAREPASALVKNPTSKRKKPAASTPKKRVVRRTKATAKRAPRKPAGDLKDVYPVGLKPIITARDSVTAGDVKVHTRDIGKRLVEFIEDSANIVGCVAWIRDRGILEALAGDTQAQIVVQKETMLKDNADLKRQLKAISNPWRLSSMPEPLSLLGPDANIAGCRCVGQHIGKANPGAPRMHHKFLVDVAFNPRGRTDETRWMPKRVWTGSFNFSRNADASLENAVEIADPRVAQAYFAEWMKVLAISEPLDWTARMPKPEWKKA